MQPQNLNTPSRAADQGRVVAVNYLSSQYQSSSQAPSVSASRQPVAPSGGTLTPRSPRQMYDPTQSSATQQSRYYGATSSEGKRVSQEARHVTTTTQPSTFAGGRSVSTTSRVVGHEYGPERVISVSQHVDESQSRVVSERYIDHQVRVPKKVTREEIIEKIVVVPERVLHEEIVEDTAMVRERIIEVAHPVVVEKIVEVPEYEYVEKVVEVPEIVRQDRIRHVDKVIQQERVHQVVKVIPQERIVEVPDIRYREYQVEKIVHVDDWRDEVRVHHVPVPQYVDKPVPEVVQVEEAVDVERIIPVPVEANITYEFRIPKIKPRYHKVTYPVYLPRFIEVPVNVELLQGNSFNQAETYLKQIGALTGTAASLCEIENLAANIMRSDLAGEVARADLQGTLLKKWRDGTLTIGPQ